MINRSVFEEKINKIIEQEIKKKRFIKALNQLMFDNHNITPGETSKIIYNLQDATPEELFWLTQSLTVVLKNPNVDTLLDYFSSNEKRMYAKTTKKVENLDKYPIIFENVMQINSDQWITTVDANKLFGLYQDQIINYNKNTQRPTIKREVNGITEYKIYVNMTSVEQIASLMKQGLFISNAITLNLSMDNPDIDFVYENGTLTLYSGLMDIIDGYHRYQALIKCKLEDENFNYQMVVNLVNFDETKACTLIAQEDKRNKINKSIIRTMDMTNPINTVIQRLNDDSRSHLYGQIGKTETSKLNSVWLFDIINACFKVKDRKDSIELVKYLKDIFNTLIEDDMMKYEFLDLAFIIKLAAMYKDSDNVIDIIESLLPQMDKEIDKSKYKNKVTKPLMQQIEKIGGVVNV